MVVQWWEACSSEPAGAEEQQLTQYWLPKLERYAKQVWDRDTENFIRASQKGSKKSETKCGGLARAVKISPPWWSGSRSTLFTASQQHPEHTDQSLVSKTI